MELRYYNEYIVSPGSKGCHYYKIIYKDNQHLYTFQPPEPALEDTEKYLIFGEEKGPMLEIGKEYIIGNQRYKLVNGLKFEKIKTQPLIQQPNPPPSQPPIQDEIKKSSNNTEAKCQDDLKKETAF